MTHASAPAMTYAVAIGSNKPLRRSMDPVAIVRAAMVALDATPLALVAQSAVIQSPPLGPSRRRYANAVAIVETALPPDALLAHLQGIEQRFGRRRAMRWGARTLDLDIILWSGGMWATPALAIPHIAFRDRPFVLTPLTQIAPEWRDPVTRYSIRHLRARLLARKRLTPGPTPSSAPLPQRF